MPEATLEPQPLADALAHVLGAPVALLALGIPLCPSCELLGTSLTEIQRHRPELTVAIAALTSPDEWAARAELLWPRGIHVSRANVPVLALFRSGQVVATRQGGGPATLIETWLTKHLGAAAAPIDEITAEETKRLGELAGLRSRHQAARAARSSS